MGVHFTNGYALIIGVGNDLPETVNDAKAIYDILVNPARCAYLPENVKLLIEKEATRQNILDTLQWLIEKTKQDKDSTAIIYFSGHGGEKPFYFLVPNDYDPGNFESTSITGSDFTRKVKEIESKRLLVLLDTCHAGGMTDVKCKLGQNFVKSPITPDVLEELSSGSGRTVIASCRKNEKSQILPGQANSVFTSALLNSFKGFGSFEQDGYVRVLDMMVYVGRVVPNWTSNQQNPIIKISELKNNFAVAYYSGGSKSVDFDGNKETAAIEDRQFTTYLRMLQNYRQNLLLIEERISEFVDFTAVPLQLIKSKRETEEEIAKLEQKVGLKL